MIFLNSKSILYVSALDSVLNVAFGKIPTGKIKAIAIPKDVFQYTHHIDTLCLPGDFENTNLQDSIQISVEYAALGVKRFLASNFGIVAVPVSIYDSYLLKFKAVENIKTETS